VFAFLTRLRQRADARASRGRRARARRAQRERYAATATRLHHHSRKSSRGQHVRREDARPYLEKTVAAQGAFVPNYWGTSHFSLGNYLSLISGESATTLNQKDCPTYSRIVPASIAAYGQVAGSGCVYPSTTLTIADQLTSAGYTYRGYMEDMGLDVTREGATCGQTQPTATTGAYDVKDATGRAQSADGSKPQDQYAQRHPVCVFYVSHRLGVV